MQRIELANSIWTLSLLPEWGGRIGTLQIGDLDVLVPINADTFDPLAWPKGGAYPLMPYSNRLRDARLHFDGQDYSLPAHSAALPHTLHGVSHTLSWQVLSADSGQAVIACDYAGEHWPWPMRAEQHFELRDDCLLIHLRLTNRGSSAMPAGLGLHPYFQRHAGMHATFSAPTEWLITDDYLANGETRQHLSPFNLEADTRQDVAHYLSGWDGLLSIQYPQGRLRMQASEVLSHFVAFAPAQAPYLCLEPVSHLADAFNRPADKWPQVGTHVIAPGASLTATLTFTWQHVISAGGV